MSFIFKSWFEEICKGDNVLLCYSGSITEQLIDDYLDKAEDVFFNGDFKKKVVKKSYYIFTEGIQNLFHHSIIDPDSGLERFGSFIIKRTDAHVEMIMGNYVLKDTAILLKNKIDHINTLEKEDIKKLYKEILNDNSFSEKGGGGLGIVDIAKKVENKLEYQIYEYDEIYSFYKLTVKINIL